MSADERATPETHTRDKAAKRYDLAYYKQLMPYIKGEVLDLGCGAGMFIREYAQKPEVVSVLGLDKHISGMPKDYPKVHSEEFNLPHEIGVSEESAKFDTIVSTEFIEHIKREDLEPFLERVKALLQPDGVFVGSTPNKIAPTRNPYHLYEYKLSELASIFKNYFTDVEMWDNGENCINWVCKL